MKFPRRTRLDLNHSSELSIYNAIQEVENLGAGGNITKAIIKLNEAKDLVSDFIDSTISISTHNS